MKKILIIFVLLFIIIIAGCSKEKQISIYIGEDGYWYIDDSKTGTYSVGQDGKSAYEIACENGYKGTVDEWIDLLTNKDGSLNVIDKDNYKKLDSKIEILNNKIFLVTQYYEEVLIREGTETAIAYEDYMYYEIFEDNNIAPMLMDSLESELDEFNEFSGSVTIQNKVYNTENQSLYVSGNESNQVVSSKTYSGKYYIASKVKCIRYESGCLGIAIDNNETSFENTTIKNTTDDFVTCSDIKTLSNNKFFIGSTSESNLDGYIDDPVIIDLSMFNVLPTVEQLDGLYEEYLKMVKGETTPNIRTELVLKEKVFYLGDQYSNYTNKEAKAAFMSYMNTKAKEIGMTNTSFVDAAGFYNRTTAYDLLRLAVYACGHDEIVETWHKNSYSITVSGAKERVENISTTVAGSALENYYFLFGGKTGTVDGQKNLLAVVEGPDERLFVVVVLGVEGDRFAAAKQAMDAAVAKYNDPTIDSSSFTVDAKSAAVCLVPMNNTLAYTDYNLKLFYEKDIYTSRTPASITKVMTSICMLDFVGDLNESFVIYKEDLTAGSGYIFQAGDIITYKEALHAMLLPSSNTAAEAVATSVGHKILQNK